jgi:hypothetical protein
VDSRVGLDVSEKRKIMVGECKNSKELGKQKQTERVVSGCGLDL